MIRPPSSDPAADAARFYVRLRQPGATRDDRAALSHWREADPTHADAWARIRLTDGLLAEVADDPAIAALRAEALGPTPHTSRWRAFAAAAAVLVSVGAGSFALLRNDIAAPVPQPVRYAAADSLRNVPLPDGTMMTLDAGSAATVFPQAIERRVSLDTGRALFAVTKDPAHPFVVSAAGTSVTALGTRFAVDRHATDTVVALTEGSVRVVTPAGTRVLVPGQVLSAGRSALTVTDGAEQETGWRDGRLTFADVPLGEVAAALNRYAGRRIVLRDAALARHRYSGSLRTTGGSDALVAALVATGAARVVARDETAVTLAGR